METLLGQQDSLKTPEAVTRKIVSDARKAFADVADDAFLDAAARQAVGELWRDSIKVTSFVPVLAMRRIRELVTTRSMTTVGVGGSR